MSQVNFSPLVLSGIYTKNVFILHGFNTTQFLFLSHFLKLELLQSYLCIQTWTLRLDRNAKVEIQVEWYRLFGQIEFWDLVKLSFVVFVLILEKFVISTHMQNNWMSGLVFDNLHDIFCLLSSVLSMFLCYIFQNPSGKLERRS